MTERLSALVLDSDPASLSTISETLAKFNLKVFPFQTAGEALDFVECGAAKEAELDLVLAEVSLNNMAPGTSANFDLLHYYILNELQLPLTAMYSCDDEEALSESMNLGACFHVLKPLDRRSFSILWHQALEHKSKKAKSGMVSSSTEMHKEVLILEGKDLSDQAKKRNRITWTIELHEKFSEAVEALGGIEYATPEGILHLMNIKGLTAKHIGSHLQKQRLRHRNAKQGGQHQENASRKPMPELIISAHDEATSESITPRVETDGEVYPLRLWTEVKKRSVDTAALKTDLYTCTSGNYKEDTASVCVWDKYENNLHGVFSEKKKRWQFMSKHRWQVRQNGYAEATRDNDHMENTNLLKGNAGSSNLLTGDQVRQNNLTEAARNNDTMGNNNFLEGIVDLEYNASMDFSVAWAHLKSNDLDLPGPSNGREEVDSFWMGQLERSQEHQILGPEDFLQRGDNPYNDALGLVKVDELVTQESQEHQSLGMEDLQQVDDIPWDDALISVGLINLLDEPMTEEAAIGGSQDQRSLAPEVLQASNNAWDDGVRSARMVNLLDEPIAHEAAIGDALMDECESDSPTRCVMGLESCSASD